MRSILAFVSLSSTLMASALMGCAVEDVGSDPKPNTSSDPSSASGSDSSSDSSSGTSESESGGDPGPLVDLSVESLMDVNPTSATFDQLVHPTDYGGSVSAWYFGHST